MSDEQIPSTNGGAAARTEKGRFRPGWRGGPGNPHIAKVAAYRAAIWNAVSEDDVADIARRLVILGKAGDVAAAKVIFERCAGKPVEVAEEDSDDAMRMARFMRAFVEAAMSASEGDPNADLSSNGAEPE